MNVCFFECKIILITSFLYKKNFYKEMSLQNSKTLRKCSEYLQPQLPGIQFLKTLILLKLQN